MPARSHSTAGDERRRLTPGQGTVVPRGVRHTLATHAGARLIEAWNGTAPPVQAGGAPGESFVLFVSFVVQILQATPASLALAAR